MKPLFLTLLCLVGIARAATPHVIGVGSGELLPSAFTKVNSNFAMVATGEFNNESGVVVEDFSMYSATNAPFPNLGIGFSSPGVVAATASKIVARVFRDGVTRNVLQFNSRGDYVRPMPWGTNWQELNVSFLIGISNIGGLFTNQIAFGLASRTNSGLFQAGNSNFVGLGISSVSGGTVFQHSNSLVEAYYGFAPMTATHKTNTVTAVNIALSGSSGDGWAALPRFTQHLLKITRADYITNQSIAISGYGPSRLAPPDTSSHTVLDSNPTVKEQYYDVMAELATGHKTTDQSATTISSINTQENFSGKLDSICISWAYSSSIILEVASIVVRKVR